MEKPKEPDWWDDLLPCRGYPHPPGAMEMLRVIAYDISDGRRLRRIAKICGNYGVRSQKSIFECWLDDERFEQMWQSLCGEMDKKEDSLFAYVLDASSSKKRRIAGASMVCTEKRSAYIF